jgi:hypothetical protein
MEKVASGTDNSKQMIMEEQKIVAAKHMVPIGGWNRTTMTQC